MQTSCLHGTHLKPGRTFLLAGIFLFLAMGTLHSDPPELTRYTLDNGMRVLLIQMEDAKSAAVITVLPMGLANDGKGQTQWSHLIEHLTVLSTGPIADFRERNAETMQSCMHLDFTGKAAQWKEGLDLQVKWLSNPPLSREIMDQEIPKALAEVDATAPVLATHKWAFAAWNQVCRHGLSHAAVYGDMRGADFDAVCKSRDERLVDMSRVVLCVASPRPAKEVKPAIQERFGTMEARPAIYEPAHHPAPPRGLNQATWDVEANHYMETYALPDTGHDDFPSLYIAGMLLYGFLYTDAELKKETGMVLCGTDLVTPESAYLWVSASLKPGASPEKVAARIRIQLDKLTGKQFTLYAAKLAKNFAAQMATLPDMNQIDSMDVPEFMVVGNLALQRGINEARFPGGVEAMAEAVGKVTQEDVMRTAANYFAKDQGSGLVLIPAVKKDE